ncbi:MAG: LysM peptidoglycan-binding domain-containing protein [Pirellulales bacterium]
MRSKQPILIAGGVVATGLVVALLFRKPSKPPGEDTLAPAVVLTRPAMNEVPPRVGQPEAVIERPASGVPSAVVVPATAGNPPSVDAPLPDQKPLQPWVDPQPPRIGLKFPGTDLPAAAAEPSEPKLRTHRVHDGDTLEKLARRYLGDSSRAAEIMEANRDLLCSPDLLPIGLELRIPAQGTP